MNLEDLEKRVAGYRRYVEDCDASGMSITRYAELHGCKREHYYHCLKAIRNYEEKKATAQMAAPAQPDSRLPILSVKGKSLQVEAYEGFDQNQALLMLAFVMRHDTDADAYEVDAAPTPISSSIGEI